jgi:hypothetical protein
MTKIEFEQLLEAATQQLTREARKLAFTSSKQFENRVRKIIDDLKRDDNIKIELDPSEQGFPDIAVGDFGIEVKFTTHDTWRSVANSVLESTRVAGVKHIYLVFGKMGGMSEVKWGVYEKCVMHVRTSHVPRFEVEIDASESLFDKMGISYSDFAVAPLEEKMKHIRKYARARLAKGERLWWLEDSPGEMHALPMSARIYVNLPKLEQNQLRAEAALLCPQVVKPGSSRDKYNDFVLYLLIYRGVLCTNARDLFSAGSAGGTKGGKRGGNYVEIGLKTIEAEMRRAARELDDTLFVEYWGESVKPEHRIAKWLRRADGYATKWKTKPSKVLFRKS